MKTLSITLANGAIIEFFGEDKTHVDLAIQAGLASPYGRRIQHALDERARQRARRQKRKTKRQQQRNARKGGR
ncbi:hypothetical protein KRX11_01040 [Pasteurellaceae bacterium TAE3-ERU1]|nr:hypothetical protein [Pasteurellaceae bacterium TAE3-ERU1]